MNSKIPWPEKKEDLTSEEAEYIRNIRLGLNGENAHSWRAVSEAFCKKFYPEAEPWPACSGNQMHGMELCHCAAEYFGEDPNSEPWN